MADYPLGKVSIRPRGAYTSNTTYNFLDAVQDRGGTWLSLAASKDIEPGVTSGWQSYWMAFAQGIQSVEITSPATGKATITVTYSNGTSTSTTIDTAAIPAGGVGTNELAEGSVITSKIADDSVTFAKLAKDAFITPIINIGSKITVTELFIGKMLRMTDGSLDYLVYFTKNPAIPAGATYPIFRNWAKSNKIVFSSACKVFVKGEAESLVAPTFTMNDPFTLIAVQKIFSDSDYDYWLVSGDVEVVT